MTTIGQWVEQQYPSQAKLVVLHPNVNNQNLFLPYLMNQSDCAVIEVAILGKGTTLNEIWDSFQKAFAEQADVTLAPLSSFTTLAKASNAIAKALKEVGRCKLILDNYDLVDESTASPLISGLISQLPKDCQIVLTGRALPKGLLSDPSVLPQAALFPVDPERMLHNYLVQPPERVMLEVFAHGVGQALVNGRTVEQWDGVLPRSLFFYIVDRGMTTRDEIFQTFWPTLTVREATNVFHVTKRKISEILGFDLTVYWSGFYRISPDIDLHYDVVKFVENLQNSAIAEDDVALEMLERSVYLYRGTFLNGLSVEWADERREELRGNYVEALSSLARLYERREDLSGALGLFMRASAIQPHREDLARGMMTLYNKVGQPDRAGQVYQRLVQELKKTLNVGPDRRTVELMEQIDLVRQPSSKRR